MHSAREGADQRTGFDARRQAWQTKCSHHHVSMIGGWCRGRREAFNYNKKKKVFWMRSTQLLSTKCVAAGVNQTCDS